ncbi:MAG: hypothetical protein KGO02_24510 [Alphaproteobacteria bacterium]|nr:hypothetical protein [Alphaproteobacteria bacterium]
MSAIDPSQVQAQWVANMAKWSTDYQRTSANALSVEWFVSPLDYFWPDGKTLADKMFVGTSAPNKNFDMMAAPEVYKTTMKAPFRAKMIVYAFMRQPISKTYGLEIENGLLHLYRLDFLSSISQWIYVIEGYCRQLYSVTSQNNVKSTSWKIPKTGDTTLDGLIDALSKSLAFYLDGALFKDARDPSADTLRRHILLHGNLQSKDYFSQKNALLLLFLLDALVAIEMISNKAFPKIFYDESGEAVKISQRTHFYVMQLQAALSEENAIRKTVLEQHP